MPIRFLFFSVVAALFLGACSTTNHISVSNSEFAPVSRKDCRVAVLTQRPSDGNYKEIAVISTRGDNMVSSDRLKQETIARACELGANALVITEFTSPNTLGFFIAGSSGNFNVLAIRTGE